MIEISTMETKVNWQQQQHQHQEWQTNYATQTQICLLCGFNSIEVKKFLCATSISNQGHNITFNCFKLYFDLYSFFVFAIKIKFNGNDK